MKTDNKIKFQDLAVCAMLTALTFVMSHINFKLPLTGSGGLVHFGNIPVVVAAVCFGRKQAAVCGALGMALFDIMSPYATWALPTFIIRLAVGYIMGYFAEKGQGKSFRWNLTGVIVSGGVLIAGYFIAYVIMSGSLAGPIAGIPGDAVQVASAALIGLPVAASVKKSIRISND